jgi:putative transposase
MARPLRIEYAGALYHVTARGNARQNIYFSDEDRKNFLDTLAWVCERNHWLCHAYCLMSNHYHLLIETNTPTLSKGMKLLNGTYTQYVNRTYKRVGHVFQGRFKAILVEKNAYLLELCRYVVLNPVRAEMVRSAKDWPWSSYRATAGMVDPVAALTTDWILGNFGKQRKLAVEAYKKFVAEGKNQPSPWQALKNQIYLGSDNFVDDVQCKMDVDQSLKGIPKPQKLAPPKPLAFYVRSYPKEEGMARAYLSGHYTLAEVGEAFGKSYATVSRAVKAIELAEVE